MASTDRIHRWLPWQLRLRTLFLLMLVCAIVLGGIASRRQSIARQLAAEQLARKSFDALRPFRPRWADLTDGSIGCFFDSSNYWMVPAFTMWQRHFSAPGAHCVYLGLENSGVTDGDLKNVKAAWPGRPVTAINLSGTKISDYGIPNLVDNSKLTFLVLDDTQLTNIGLMKLEELTSLRFVSVVGTAVTDEGIAQFRAKLPHCWVNYKQPLHPIEKFPAEGD